MKKILFTLTLFFVLSSCESTLLNDPEDIAYKSSHISTLEEQFEYLWHGINNSYVFWDIDSTDWDKVYDQYLPRFRELDQIGMRDGSLPNSEIRNLVEGFASNFVDRHMVIGFSNPYNSWQQITYQPKSLGLFDSYKISSRNTTTKFSLKSKYETKINSVNIDGGIEHSAYFSVIEEGIVYLNVPCCYFSVCESPEFLSFLDQFSTQVKQLSQTNKLKGIILDFRGNLGGVESDVDFFLQLFIDEPTDAFYIRYKKGLGKYDYAPWIPYVVQPNLERQICSPETPIVTLIDSFSASGGEIIPASLRTLPNSFSIGETTIGAQGGCLGGGGSTLIHSGSFNYIEGGSEQILGAYARMASCATMLFNPHTKDFECLEGVGFTPDEIVPFGDEDEQLDAAVERIKGQNK